MISKPLSPRQRFLLTYIETFLTERGYVPTLAEMAKALEVSSLQAVKDHLTALERKGYLRRSHGRSRGAYQSSGNGERCEVEARGAE